MKEGSNEKTYLVVFKSIDSSKKLWGKECYSGEVIDTSEDVECCVAASVGPSLSR
jgi:hypothetical protein